MLLNGVHRDFPRCTHSGTCRDEYERQCPLFGPSPRDVRDAIVSAFHAANRPLSSSDYLAIASGALRFRAQP